MAPDAVSDDAPNLTPIIADGQGGEVRVLSRQLPGAILPLEPFDCELPVDDCDHDVVRLRRDAAVYDHQVAVKDPGAAHGLTSSPDEEGGCRPPHQMLVEIELALDVVIGWAWKASFDRRAEQRQLEMGGMIDGAQQFSRSRMSGT